MASEQWNPWLASRWKGGMTRSGHLFMKRLRQDSNASRTIVAGAMESGDRAQPYS